MGIMKKLVIARRFSQAFFLLLFLGILWPFAHPLERFLSSRIFSRTDPLVMIFSSISQRAVLQGMVFSFIMLLATLVLGRFFCGWICPLGTAIDWTGALRKKKTFLNSRAAGGMRAVKFYILGLVAVFSLFGVQASTILDPLGIMARFIFLTLAPALEMGIYYLMESGAVLLLFVLICFSALFISRFWCRAVCPLGALYALVAKFSLLERKITKCDSCGTCVGNCRMGAIKEDAGYIKEECILCMDCVYDCPRNATKFTWVSF